MLTRPWGVPERATPATRRRAGQPLVNGALLQLPQRLEEAGFPGEPVVRPLLDDATLVQDEIRSATATLASRWVMSSTPLSLAGSRNPVKTRCSARAPSAAVGSSITSATCFHASHGSSAVVAVRSHATVPDVGSSRPHTSRGSVLLPVPFSPTGATISPLRTWRDTPVHLPRHPRGPQHQRGKAPRHRAGGQLSAPPTGRAGQAAWAKRSPSQSQPVTMTTRCTRPVRG